MLSLFHEYRNKLTPERFRSFKTGCVGHIGVDAYRLDLHERGFCFSLEAIWHERTFCDNSGERLFSGFGAFDSVVNSIIYRHLK